MKDFIVSIRMFLFWTIVLGLVYPLLFTGAAQILFPKQANGGVVMRGGQVIGAKLIGQKFAGARYFWSRPSAVDYNPLPSGGSNSGPTSETLKASMFERSAQLKSANPDAGEPPQDLLFASGSGLDPHISIDAAEFQSLRIAKNRSMTVSEVRNLISEATEPRQFGILGEPRVNVLALNNSLDVKQGITAAPTPAPTAVPTPLTIPAQAPPTGPPTGSAPGPPTGSATGSAK